MKVIAMLVALSPFLLIGGVGAAFLASPTPDDQIEWLEVADLSALPADGRPRDFLVKEPHHDAWSRLSDRPVERVFLRRDAHSGDVTALDAYHGPFGDCLYFDEQSGCFYSICYIVRFDLEGRMMDDPRIKPGTYAPIRRREVQMRGDRIFVRRAPFISDDT